MFQFMDEIGTYPHDKVLLELKDKLLFFIQSYAIKEEEKPITVEEITRLGRLGIVKKGLTDYSLLVLLAKEGRKMYTMSVWIFSM